MPSKEPSKLGIVFHIRRGFTDSFISELDLQSNLKSVALKVSKLQRMSHQTLDAPGLNRSFSRFLGNQYCNLLSHLSSLMNLRGCGGRAESVSRSKGRGFNATCSQLYSLSRICNFRSACCRQTCKDWIESKALATVSAV